MLSKSDLSQIQKTVKDVVRTEVESEARNTRREITAEMKLFRMRLEERMYDLENKVKDLDIRTESHFKIVQGELKKIKKTIDTMAGFFDKEDVMLRKRVERIEEHLNVNN